MLTRSQIRQLLDWPDLIAAAEGALRSITGTSSFSSSDHLDLPGASLHLKSGGLLEPSVLSVKANLRPVAGGSVGAVLVFDPGGVRLRAVLDSADITAMRTAAVAAVVAAALHPTNRPAVLAVVGAGPVGEYSIAALRKVLPISAVRIWSRSGERSERLACRAGGDVSVHGSPAETAAGASIILTCTPSRSPIVERSALSLGSLVLAMGADTRGKRELAADVLFGATVIADQLDNAMKVGECAYLAPAQRDNCYELGAVLTGTATLPPDRALTVFDSVGSAVVDAATVDLVLRLAERFDVGSHVDLGA